MNMVGGAEADNGPVLTELSETEINEVTNKFSCNAKITNINKMSYRNLISIV